MIDRLLRTRADTVISTYLRLPDAPAEQRGVPIRLEEQLRRAGIDSRAAPELKRGAETIREAIAELHDALRGGVALFVSGEIDLFEQARFPCAFQDRVVVGKRPYVRPLLAARQRCPTYHAVVTDNRRSTLVTASADGLWESAHVTSPGMRKPNFAGRYGLEEYTVRNQAEELIRRHHRQTVGAVEKALEGDERAPLVVGGPRHSVTEFLAMVPPHVRERLAGTFVTDPHTATPAEVRRDADEVIDRWNRERESELIHSVWTRAGAAGARAVSGPEQCLAAVNERAVDLLLVREDDIAAGFVCDNCDLIALREATCAVCGAPARPVPDVYEEMIVSVLMSGGTVEQVGPEALEAGRPTARLRFPTPVAG